MTPEELTKKLKRLAGQSRQEIDQTLTEKMETEGLRFVDDNFINQSWEGHPWQANAQGSTILVKTGNLKSGFRSSRGTGEVRIQNVVRYAKAHNEGFRGRVSVKEHTRGQFSGSRTRRKRSGSVTVSGHIRTMKLPRRQFAPTAGSPSPTLNRNIVEMSRTHLVQFIQKT